jgi:hypothetical protein
MRLWSPLEMFRSAVEFLWRAVWSWLAAFVATLATIAYVLEHVAPSVHITGRLWLRVVIVGAVLSLVWAYHRTRCERELARAPLVDDAHGKELTDRLRLHLSHVRERRPSDYDDVTPDGPADRASFGAHYPERSEEVDRWSEQIRQKALYGKLKEELRREAQSDEPGAAKIDPGIFDVQMVTDYVWVWLLKTASDGEFDDPVRLAWETRFLPDRTDLELAGNAVGELPAGLPDELATPVQEAAGQVFALATAALAWPDAQKIKEGKDAAERLRGPLVAELDVDLRARDIPVVPSECPVCRRNRERRTTVSARVVLHKAWDRLKQVPGQVRRWLKL